MVKGSVVSLGSVLALLGSLASAHAAPQRQLADLPDENSLPKTHVIYAVPADGLDRHLDTNGTLSVAVLSMKQWIGDQLGRQPRFDYSLGALDVSFVRLTTTSDVIRAASLNGALQIFGQELALAGFSESGKAYAVYYDGAGSLCGAGRFQGLLAIAFLQSCGTGAQLWDLVMLHEMIHGFGGVDPNAPHGTSDYHVSDDPQDLMVGTGVVQNPHLDLDHQDYVGHTLAGQFDVMSSPYFETAAPFNASACQAAIVDDALTAPLAGGDLTTFVIAPRACIWTLSQPPSWITDNGIGFGTSFVTLHVSRNTQVSSRQVTLTVNGIAAVNALEVQQPAAPNLHGWIDLPAQNATLHGTFTLAGWFFDQSSLSGAGLTLAHVWAFPDAGAAPIFLGAAALGLGRPDVAAAFQAPQAASSGFGLTGITLPVGGYRIIVYPADAISQQFEFGSTLSVHVTMAPPASDPVMALDVPASGQVFTGGFIMIAGWAADRDAATCGVDVIHVWAYPIVNGIAQPAAAQFVAAAPVNVPRADVAAFLGNPSANRCGFGVISILPPGTYQIVAFAHSTITGTFNNAKVIAPVIIKN